MTDRRTYKREYMRKYRNGKGRDGHRAIGRNLKPNPKLEPEMRERHAVVMHLIREGEIDGVLGLSYIVWPPEMDTAAGTVGRDRSRRAA